MEVGLRSKLFFLYLWCGVLSVAVVVLTIILTTNQQKTPQEGISTEEPPISTSVRPMVAEYRSEEKALPSLSFIQLILDAQTSWTLDSDLSSELACESCSLGLKNSSIQCREDGLYLLYAHVAFKDQSPSKSSVSLKKNHVPGHSQERVFVKVNVPESQRSFSVMKLVSLQKDDSVSIEIKGTIYNHETFWGMVQLQRQRS